MNEDTAVNENPMASVLGDKQRARTPKEKDRRRESILQSALELFLANSAQLPTISAIAKRAGVAKGTAYIYFDTKESIYLALLEQQMHAWLQHIQHELQYNNPDPVQQLVDAILGFRTNQPHLWPLASLSHAIIETNIDSKALLSYKTKLAQQYKTTARHIREHFKLTENQSTAVESMLMQTYAYLLGSWQVSNPPASIGKLLRGPGFSVLQPDFTQTSQLGVTQLWLGFVEQQRKGDGSAGVLNKFFGRR